MILPAARHRGFEHTVITTHRPARGRGVDPYLLWPILVPLVLLAAGNDDFGFDPPGWIDPFVYAGYFWHYPEHLWVFDDNSNYKVSRLPWILPAYVLHTLTGPIAATYLLVFLTLAGGGIALYLLVRDALDDRPAAAITAITWASCTSVHGAGGWNYHALGASVYYFVACWQIVRAAHRPAARWSALGAGAAYAAAVHTNLLLAAFAPLIALLYWAARMPGASVRRDVELIMWFAFGGVALTAALAVINYATGGSWLFFLPQIEQARKLSQPGGDVWWVGDVTKWLPGARYLVIAIAFLVLGLIVPLRSGPNRRLSLVIVALGWAGFTILAFLQFVRHQATLDASHLAFPVYLHAFPCVGAAASGFGLRDHPWRTWIVGGCAAATVGTLLLLLPSALPQQMEHLSAALVGAVAPILPPLAFSVAGIAATWLLPMRARTLAFIVWFSIVNGWIAPNPAGYGISTPGQRRDMLQLVHDVDRFTTTIDPSLYGIKYWMADDELTTRSGRFRLRPLFDSFVSTRTWFGNLLGRQAPSPPIDELTIEDLERGRCIGLLSAIDTHAGLRLQLETHFASLAWPLALVGERRFSRGDLSFVLTVLRAPRSGSALACNGVSSSLIPDSRHD